MHWKVGLLKKKKKKDTIRNMLDFDKKLNYQM